MILDQGKAPMFRVFTGSNKSGIHNNRQRTHTHGKSCQTGRDAISPRHGESTAVRASRIVGLSPKE